MPIQQGGVHPPNKSLYARQQQQPAASINRPLLQCCCCCCCTPVNSVGFCDGLRYSRTNLDKEISYKREVFSSETTLSRLCKPLIFRKYATFKTLSADTVTYKQNFSKLKVCFFVISSRKPYAKNRLVTSPMTSGDPERSKRAEPNVVYLGLTSQGNRKSTNLVLFERAYTTFY